MLSGYFGGWVLTWTRMKESVKARKMTLMMFMMVFILRTNVRTGRRKTS